MTLPSFAHCFRSSALLYNANEDEAWERTEQYYATRRVHASLTITDSIYQRFAELLSVRHDHIYKLLPVIGGQQATST